MKTAALLLAAVLMAASCSEDDDPSGPSGGDTWYRQEMRSFVSDLSAWAKTETAGFIVIPQNGQELITDTGEADGTPQTSYIASIDATGREDMFYGYTADNQPTPASENAHFLSLCLLCEEFGVEVLATDYCWTQSYMDDSYAQNAQNGFISFAAEQRDLNIIPDYPPEPWNVNSNNITDISQSLNFLYLINSENFATKQDFIDAVSQTDYDVIIMDLFHNDEQYTAAEIDQLRTKSGGGSRLVICYLSIGEAEDYRYYWQSEWNTQKPQWLGAENPYWPGNYKVNYWDPAWQAIIFGEDDSYLQRIMDSGFDGAYLDLIDAFEYFEER